MTDESTTPAVTMPDGPTTPEAEPQPPALRVTLVFDPESEAPKKYGTDLHRLSWSDADFANEVAEMVRRTVTAHLGLNPTLPPLP